MKKIILILLVVFSNSIFSQDLIFDAGWNNSNYDVNMLGITTFDNLIIKEGATVLLKDVNITVKGNVFQQANSIVHIHASLITYGKSSNSFSKFVVKSKEITTLGENINLSSYKEEVVIRCKGKAILAGEYNDIKDVKIKQGIYNITCGGKLIVSNFLIK